VSVDEIVMRIAGSVVVSRTPGLVLRSWRQRLCVQQISLAKQMGVSPSVLSDYESGRRSSPGIGFVRRYLEALVTLDTTGGRLLEKTTGEVDHAAILSMGEFRRPVTARKLANAIKADILTGDDLIDSCIYGFTVLDSVRTIYALSGLDFYRIFGTTTERLLLFTKVGLGRSPMVAVRVSPLKPRMVILHGPKVVDPLAIDLAKRERIILGVSLLTNESEFTPILSNF
jgi:putative transcriptional regulator